MTAYFWLKIDTDTFHSLAFEHEADRVAYRVLSSTSRAIEWTPRWVSPVDADEENAVYGDFIALNRAVVIGERVRRQLGSMLLNSGELLPLLHETRALWAYHVTAVADAFDSERSEFERFASSDDVKKIHRFVMKLKFSSQLDVFRPSGVEWAGVIVSEAFVNLVKVNSLTGLFFSPIARA